VFVPGRPCQPSLMFSSKVRNIKGSTLKIGFNLFRLGCKGLPGIKTLAYHEHSFFTTVIFYDIGPRAQ
jgi:hypothetical protein